MKVGLLLLVVGFVQSATHAPTTTMDPEEVRLKYIENSMESMARQMMLQQLFVEERSRSEGDSGIKQVRSHHKGTKPYFSDTHNMGAVNAIHDHSNYGDTVGMGEVSAVLNGVEFRTRHNDFQLRMPSKTSTGYHATQALPFPPVPKSVTSKHTLQEQIEEMRKYFQAWKYQNTRLRDYKPYFKPVLCYMEGAWTTNTNNLEEPFFSQTHHNDAFSWSDLRDKIRFTAYTGGKQKSENLSFLPRTIMNVKDGKVEYAQWNYRILCNPIKDDLPLQIFEPIDDLAARLPRHYDLRTFAKTRAARFNLASETRFARYDPDFGYGAIYDRMYSYAHIDRLMAEVPGVNNYRANLSEASFGMLMYSTTERDKVLNTGFYHRRFKYNRPGAMGTTNSNRGYNDINMWVAQTTSDHIASIELNDCKRINRTLTKCTKYNPKYTYAIPLEIIYLTPLHNWNPYGLPWRPDVNVTAGGRHGGFDNKTAYNGMGNKYFYRTPTEFFSGTGIDRNEEAEKSSVGVFDGHGHVRKVVPSGVRIFLPSIPGVGSLRQRWPIAPVYREGSSMYKELDALKEMINHIGYYSNILEQHPSLNGKVHTQKPDAHFRTTLATKDPPGRHYHELFVDDMDYNLALHGRTVKATTTEESSHTHDLELMYNSHTKQWTITKCDGLAHCWDGHSNVLTKIA